MSLVTSLVTPNIITLDSYKYKRVYQILTTSTTSLSLVIVPLDDDTGKCSYMYKMIEPFIAEIETIPSMKVALSINKRIFKMIHTSNLMDMPIEEIVPGTRISYTGSDVKLLGLNEVGMYVANFNPATNNYICYTFEKTKNIDEYRVASSMSHIPVNFRYPYNGYQYDGNKLQTLFYIKRDDVKKYEKPNHVSLYLELPSTMSVRKNPMSEIEARPVHNNISIGNPVKDDKDIFGEIWT